MAQAMRQARKVVLLASAAIITWISLTWLGASMQHAAWALDPAGQSNVLTSPTLRPLGNALNVASKPGWIVVVRVGPSHPVAVRSMRWALVAHGMSWGGYVAVALSVWLVWRRWYRLRPRAPFVAPRRTPTDGTDLSRRAVLLHGVGGLAAMSGGGAVAKATVLEPTDLRVRRFSAPIRDLPRPFDGLRIVVVSDTHLGPFVAPEFIARAVAAAVDLRPDLVALVGDYSHHDTREIDPGIELLAPLCAPGASRFGAVAVLGNHDWFSGASATREALRRIGARLVENTRVFLDADTLLVVDDPPVTPARGVCIAGVGDLDHDDVDLAGALGGVSDATPRVLLSHNPDVAEHWLLPRFRADLMLCGHTHGGQVRLPLLGAPIVPVRTGQRYADGLNAGPMCPVVTSRGVGMSHLPVRFNCPPEVVEVTLRAASRECER